VVTDSFSFAIIPFDKDTLAANIQANHPMLRMFELQQEVSKQAILLNELNGKPSFGVGLDYIFVNPRTDAEPSNNGRDILQIRALVKIPLYRKKYEAKEREENFKIAALENVKEDALTRFTATIEKAYADYETAQLKSSLYKKQIGITQSAIDILETDYSTQGNNFDELLRLENELIDYDLKMLKVVVQSHQAKIIIEKFIITD
jgi:outer membrane protein TolC